jgi:hypothetical protein
MLRVQVPLALLGAEEVPAEVPSTPDFTAGHIADLPAAEAAPLCAEPGGPEQAWVMACPDVFSIRHSSVEAYLEPVVHEIKVSRADLLGDLKKPAKRAAYLGLASACWYVLGQDAKGRSIGAPDEIPAECGVLLVAGGQLVVAREAPRRAIERVPFHVWMALAKAGPAVREAEGTQGRF